MEYNGLLSQLRWRNSRCAPMAADLLHRQISAALGH
jgi:hypothetical protein